MPINKIYADTPAMGIAREIMAHNTEVMDGIKAMAKRHDDEIEAYSNAAQQRQEEDVERLRLALNIPNKILNPKIDSSYFKDFGELYLHHGVEIREASPAEALFAKLFSKGKAQ